MYYKPSLELAKYDIYNMTQSYPSQTQVKKAHFVHDSAQNIWWLVSNLAQIEDFELVMIISGSQENSSKASSHY